MKMKFALALACGVASLGMMSNANAATIIDSSGNTVSEIDGLSTGGTTYDVTFTTTAVVDFSSESAADAAASNLAAFITSHPNQIGSFAGCSTATTCSVLIPYKESKNGTTYTAVDDVVTFTEKKNGKEVVDSVSIITGDKVSSSATNVYADFSPAGSGNLAVPEPATWAFMLLGFGMVGFAMRKRNAQRPVASFA